MQNKRFLFILLPAAIGIWGVIIYQIASSVSGTEQAVQVVASVVPSDDFTNPSDTFALLANYSDPFLKKSGPRTVSNPGVGYKAVSPAIATSRPSTVPAPPVVEETVWPVIEYLGQLQNSQKRKKVALLSVAGKEYLVGDNQQVGELRIDAIAMDSVRITFRKKWKYLRIRKAEITP